VPWYSNMLITTLSRKRGFEAWLDPFSIADKLLGATYYAGSFGPWWATYTLDMTTGYAKARYDLWSGQLGIAVDIYEAF
jgi:hypothetical protein